jgi:hypothetical protein
MLPNLLAQLRYASRHRRRSKEFLLATSITDQLLQSDNPSVRWKLRTKVFGESRTSVRVQSLEREISKSERVRALLRNQIDDGTIAVEKGEYAKWQGAHWVLSSLADIGYPEGDQRLRPVADQLLNLWLGEEFFNEFEASSKSQVYGRYRDGVPLMNGRYRRCATQQSNALWTILTLGLYTAQCDRLVERLLYWQWPDGGWNCDKNPEASTASFIETLFPVRGLAKYQQSHPSTAVKESIERAAEVFLERQLFRRKSDGSVIREEFTKLHYPTYWHYDILVGLKAMAESGHIDDPRCAAALDLLESKRLSDGGWPAESKYYKVSSELARGADYVDWGGTGKKKMNEWVSVDALSVLAAAGRLN